MTPTTASVGVHAHFVHIETCALEPRLELTIRAAGPHGQNAVRPERKTSTLQAPDIIEAVVGPPRESFRSIVDVEQDGIVLRRPRLNDPTHVCDA